MILGASRTPFQRPAAASGAYVPQLPNTAFYSNLQPFSKVTHAMRSWMGYRPSGPPSMGPHALPAIPAAAVVPAAVAPTVPKAGGTAGAFTGSGFGSPGGTRPHMHMDPYMVMKYGGMPGIMPSGANIRGRIRNTGAIVHSSYPYQTAPLPVEVVNATPVVAQVTPATAPSATAPVAVPGPTTPSTTAPGVKGLMGVLADHLGFGPHRRRRHWFFNPMTITASPPAIASNSSCERIGPRSDGLFVTICNGRVTEYSDAAGNVHANPYADPSYGA